MSTRTDLRAIARARSAVNDARSQTTHAAGSLRHAVDGPARDNQTAIGEAQSALEHVWESLAYIDAELALAMGDEP